MQTLVLIGPVLVAVRSSSIYPFVLFQITISVEVKAISFARIVLKNQLAFQKHLKSCYKSISSNHFQKAYSWLIALFDFLKILNLS